MNKNPIKLVKEFNNYINRQNLKALVDILSENHTFIHRSNNKVIGKV